MPLNLNIPHEMWDNLNEAERRLTDLLPVIDKWEACDEDCSEIRQIVAALLERISKYKTQFGSAVRS